MDTSTLNKIPESGSIPNRVVSLVPSITESLFVLGFGESVVGITDYCIYPKDQVAAVAKVGGTKNPDINQIKKLTPELVFVNQEENTPETIQGLVDLGIDVWMSFPKSVEEAVDLLRSILAIYHNDRSAMQINTLQSAVDWARRASENQPRISYFCPIWRDKYNESTYWMTFNQDTFSNDLLSILGGENIFSSRDRKYPLGADLGNESAEDEVGNRDIRYPRVTIEEVVAADPELIILPNEPFNFDQNFKDEILDLLSSTQAVKNNRTVFVDGSLITWPGVRVGKALSELSTIFQYS